MYYNIVLLSILAVVSFSFTKIPMTTYTRNFDNNLDNIKVYEPCFVNKENIPCVLFFTGGSSLMIPDIYNSFFSKVVHNNIAVYCPSFRYKNMNQLINLLNKEYKEVILVGHSSGATTAISYNNKRVKKIIFLDGVDTRIFNNEKRNKKHILKNIKSILFLNAGKSYKFTYDPPGLAFIPFLGLDENAIEKNKRTKIIRVEAEKYGHSDILDRSYSNMMHNSRLSVGNKNRTHEKLDNYHTWLSSVFCSFINKNYNQIKVLNQTINQNK